MPRTARLIEAGMTAARLGLAFTLRGRGSPAALPVISDVPFFPLVLLGLVMCCSNAAVASRRRDIQNETT